jgi:diguanylate cyclase (GGDEF)-like protein/PAS domain S-box-containing protein
MDYASLVGRAAHFSDDIYLIVKRHSELDEGLEFLYANNAFFKSGECDVKRMSDCKCQLSLSEPDFSNHAILNLTSQSDISKTFRVSVTALPEEEIGQPDCLLLVGQESGKSISDERVHLYSDITRRFKEQSFNIAAQQSLRSIGLYFNVDLCYIGRFHLHSQNLDYRYIWKKSSDTHDAPYRNNEFLSETVRQQIQQNEPLFLSHVPNWDNNQTKSFMMIPAVHHQGTVWFIGLDCHNSCCHWSSEDIETLKVIADLMGNYLKQFEISRNLHESQRQFSDISANIPGVVFQLKQNTQKELVLNYISAGIRDLSGYSTAALSDQPSLLEKIVIPADRGRYRETLQQAAHNQEDWSVDVRIKLKDQTETKWVRSRGKAHKTLNGNMIWNGLILDISVQHKTEEELRISEERLRKILGTSPSAIGISDVESCQLLFANKRLADMYQIKRSDIIGFDTRKIYAQSDQFQKHWQETCLGKNLDSVETQCIRMNKETFWAEITTRLIDYGGRKAVLWWSFDINEHKNTREALAHLAHHDALTGLANRRLFEEHLKSAIALAKRNNDPGVLLYFDLDGFKAVNDTHGHGFGDWVLEQVAKRITHILRLSDIAARLGGDEFGVIAHNLSNIRDIESVLDKMQDAIAEPFTKDGLSASIGLSIGVVRFFGNETNILKLIKFADQAMYQAKQDGKGRYQLVEMSPDSVRSMHS